MSPDGSGRAFSLDNPMRRIRTSLFAACTVLSLAWSAPTIAQYGGGPGGGRGADPDQQQQEDDAKRKKRDEEFGAGNAAVPALRNAGPCPYVKVLYDAARYVEFVSAAEESNGVIYTGEIQKVGSTCAYKTADPIKLEMQILFEFGRGPQAKSNHKLYHYWVAVTDRNRGVLAKQYFDLPVTFPGHDDRVTLTEAIPSVLIPRHDSKVSGGNFEVLVGFDVTPAMAAFNRDGKRFRPNAGVAAAEDVPSQR
jgi:hypothetical protein